MDHGTVEKMLSQKDTGLFCERGLERREKTNRHKPAADKQRRGQPATLPSQRRMTFQP